MTTIALWILGALSLVLMHALIVDPLGGWGTRILPETNYAVHGRARVSGDRVLKGIELSRGRYDSLIFGTSRLQSGINPQTSEFMREQVYNAAIPSGRIAEQLAVIRKALKLQPDLKRVVWGLDYFVMVSPETSTADFENSVFAGKTVFQGQLVRTFNLEAVEGSFKFWRSIARGETADMTTQGFHRQFSKKRGSSRKFFIRLAEAEARTCYETVDMDAIAANVRYVAEALKLFAEHKIEVDIVFPPTHVWMQVMSERSGALTLWEDIRTRITRQAERYARTTSSPIRVWDFDHPSSVTNEPLPEEGQQSKWFYEVSHMRPEAGQMMLRVLRNTSLPEDPPDYARLLRSHTATALFQIARNDLRAWREKNSDENKIVNKLMDEAGCPPKPRITYGHF